MSGGNYLKMTMYCFMVTRLSTPYVTYLIMRISGPVHVCTFWVMVQSRINALNRSAELLVLRYYIL